MDKVVYLDNAATTPVLAEAANAMHEALISNYGNPSSLHTKGIQAEEILKRSRRSLASFLSVPERGIYFTSGGTEADNLAILGSARKLIRRGKHIVTTAIEHAAVLGPCQALEREGWHVTYIPVDSVGRVSPQNVAEAVTADTVLVSVMTVNNEVGAIQPIPAIVKAIRSKGSRCVIHTDATQALGKVTINPIEWGVDLLTVSAHKIHGPKGCGALWVREGMRVEPLWYGGGQEQGVRSGTENVPGIAGFGAAVLELAKSPQEKIKTMRHLRDKLIHDLTQAVPQIVVNGPQGSDVAPHICSVALSGYRGEVLVHALAQEGIYVSSGAACSSHHSQAVSHVLQAMKLPEPVMQGSLRFSLSPFTSVEDIDTAVAVLAKVVRKLGPMGQ